MMDPDALLPAIAAGDDQAFEAWLAGAEHRVRLSLRRFAAYVDTEAVLQEALLRVWQVAPRVKADGQHDPLLRLAIRIGRNLAISDLRRARLTPVDVEELERLAASDPGPPEPRVGDPLLRRTIRECRDLLPTKPGLALTARLQNAGTEPDNALAVRLGMRLNTFLQNITRARRHLEDCLRRRGIDLVVELA